MFATNGAFALYKTCHQIKMMCPGAAGVALAPAFLAPGAGVPVRAPARAEEATRRGFAHRAHHLGQEGEIFGGNVIS